MESSCASPPPVVCRARQITALGCVLQAKIGEFSVVAVGGSGGHGDRALFVTLSSGPARNVSHSLGPARRRGRYSPDSGPAVPDRDTTGHLCPCRAGHLFGPCCDLCDHRL